MSSKFGKSRGGGRAVWSIAGPDFRDLKKILVYLDDMDLPLLEGALRDAGEKVASEARKGHPGVIAERVRFDGIKGTGVGMRAMVKGDHPGTKTYEFGRSYYYKRATELATTSSRGKKKWFGAKIGNNRDGSKRPKGSMKGQQRFKSPRGFQPPQPILGVMAMYGGSARQGAIQRVGPEIDQAIRKAITEEFDRKVQELGV